jgi:predicted enzyme related to lactoylglutathione lyase
VPGQLVHFEIQAKDADRATQFYSAVFGWQFNDSGMPGIDYRMTQTGENQGGAVYSSDDPDGHLTVYFDTDDIDASLAKVRDAGGEAEAKQPIPHVGWFASCKDSEGNAFSLFQSDESVEAPSQ